MNSPPPTVSILINNYNNGPWIRECVDSALDQTRPADEVIVYDDGSTDDSLDILRSYGDRIRLIEGVHDNTKPGMVNQAIAIHRAFLASSGDHVYLLDGDDRYLPEHVEKYENIWRQSPDHVMVFGSMCEINQHGAHVRSLYRADRNRIDYLRATYRVNDFDFFYPTSALAFRRALLSRHLPLDLTEYPGVASDTRLCFAALFAGTIGFVRDDSTCFRFRPGSMSEYSGHRIKDRLLESLTRIRNFNTFAARHGHRKISPWLNRTVWQQVARKIMPGWVAAPFLRWKLYRYRKMTTPTLPPAP